MIRKLVALALLVPSLAWATYSSAILADSPCVYYTMNEASGTTMADSSGFGRGGTYNTSGITYHQTGPNLNDAQLQYAIGFDGAAGFAGVTTLEPACSRPANTNAVGWTVEFSAYMTNTTARGDMVAADGSIGHEMFLIEKSQGSDAAFYMVTFDNGGAFSNTGAMGSFSVATWYLLDFTTVGNGTVPNPMKFYINGTLTTTFAFTKYNNDTVQTFLGRDGSNAGNFFGGRLSNISFYETALSQAQITAHFNAWQSVPTGGLNPFSVKRDRPWLQPASFGPDLTKFLHAAQ